MKKTIWIWNHYATNTIFDRGGRHYWMAEFLIKNGFDVYIFCASTVHNSTDKIDTKGNRYIEYVVDGIKYIVINTPDYNGNGLARILNMITFFLKLKGVAKSISEKNGNPDTIIASSVHPLTCVAGIQTSRALNTKCISEIRDLWPKSITAYTKHTDHEILIRAMYKMEKWIYMKSDFIIFTFSGGYDYICDQGWQQDIPKDKIRYINTGVNMQLFDYNLSHYEYCDDDYDDDSFFRVVYTGSIRSVNSIKWLVDAAKLAKLDLPKVRFFIFGDGDERASLERIVKDYKLNNVFFKGKVSKQYIPGILVKANLLVISLLQTDILKYGESWNKLFEYMASGNPIISTGYSEIIKEEGIGDIIKGDSEHALAAINKYLNMGYNERKEMKNKILESSKKYDCRILMQGIISMLE